MKNKKSYTTMEIVAGAFLIVFLVFVLATILPRLLGKESAQASDFLSQTIDCDGDKIADYYDYCDCLYSEQNEGCPINEPKTGEAAINREKICKEKCREGKTQSTK